MLAYALNSFTLGAKCCKNGNKENENFNDNVNYESVHRGVGAISSNGPGCAEIGGYYLKHGGSAVDAAIATLLCESIKLPHSLGIGGGFAATIYTKNGQNVETLVARETAPAKAHKDMFLDKPIKGALAVGIPGEILGYWALHKKYGNLEWKTLFKPSIDLCINGCKVPEHLATILHTHADVIRKEVSLSEIFINPRTKNVYREGDIMYRPRLGETLKIVADYGADALYGGGVIGELLVGDITKMGGIITMDDLINYKVRWESPIVSNFMDSCTVYAPPLPTSGILLTYILNVMDKMYTDDGILYWHRLIEAFKHAYGFRTNLGDVYYEPQVVEICKDLNNPSFIDTICSKILDKKTFNEVSYYGGKFTSVEDDGTANVAVLAPNGDAVIITSTVNSHLGAKIRSRSTGIILNDEMDDFSTPGLINKHGLSSSPGNYIQPGKRPLSSMCPSIVLDKDGNIQLMIGGAGGSRITTAVAQTILRYLVFNQTLEESINLPRVHHQLLPMHIDMEPNIPSYIQKYFKKSGHELNYLSTDKTYSSLTGIGMKTGSPIPICDARRPGSTIVVTEHI